jgi:hypothetical protein
MPDDDMEQALENLTLVHAQIIHNQETIRAYAERRIAEVNEALRHLESVYANEARKAGASLSRVGKAMGTTDWRTIKERLALAGEKEEK